MDEVAVLASYVEPGIVMVMLTDVDVTMGTATETLWPSALDKELVSAVVSRACSVALELRLSVALAGTEISKEICVVLCSRRPSCSRRLDEMLTEHPTG